MDDRTTYGQPMVQHRITGQDAIWRDVPHLFDTVGHRWSTLCRVVGTTECMAAAIPGFTWSRARVQVSCDTGTGSGGSLEQSGEANRDVEIASRGNLVVTET